MVSVLCSAAHTITIYIIIYVHIQEHIMCSIALCTVNGFISYLSSCMCVCVCSAVEVARRLWCAHTMAGYLKIYSFDLLRSVCLRIAKAFLRKLFGRYMSVCVCVCGELLKTKAFKMRFFFLCVWLLEYIWLDKPQRRVQHIIILNVFTNGLWGKYGAAVPCRI